MKHSKTSFVLGEAYREFLSAVRAPLVPILFLGMTVYMWFILLESGYMREIGAIGIPRNSAQVSYFMAAGQTLWLSYAWAWLFPQVLFREKQAQLAEVVLSTPIPLSLLIFARFLGLLAVAVLLGSAVFMGLASSSILIYAGALPADAIGPIRWQSMFLALIIFVIPNAIGLGSLFLAAAIWFRSNAGAYIAAAVVMLIWMVAMIVLGDGEVNVPLATILESSGYFEAEYQNQRWTPSEKQTAVLAITPPLVVNRLLWTVLPVLVLLFTLRRSSREFLLSERQSVAKKDQTKVLSRLVAPPSPTIAALYKQQAFWLSAFLLELGWQLRVCFRGFGVRLALLVLTLSGLVGTWVNFSQQSDGPFLPYPEAVMPFTAEFFYLIILFIMTGFIGAIVRRDERDGFSEWVDTTRIPLALRLLAQAITIFTLLLILCLIPGLSAVGLAILLVPEAADLVVPVGYQLLVEFGPIAELCALMVLLHVLFRHSGTAYSLSVFTIFFVVVSNEMSLFEFRAFQLGIPWDIALSKLVGWTPWLPMILTVNGLKLATAGLFLGVSLLLWRRGTALTIAHRFQQARTRLRGAGGVLVLASIIAMVSAGNMLQQRLVIAGEYRPQAEKIAADARWEKHWWNRSNAFSIESGSVEFTIEPDKQSGRGRWRINTLELSGTELHATLPHGISVKAVLANGTAKAFEIDDDHLVINLGDCAASACDLELELALALNGWPGEDVPWLHSTGVWLQAGDILPTLGHDPSRLLSARSDRLSNHLDLQLPAIPAAEHLSPLLGVAPRAAWHWRIQIENGESLAMEGTTTGPLDFAGAWLPEPPSVSQRGELVIWHSADREPTTELLSNDVHQMQSCVEEQLGVATKINEVIQAPRGMSDAGLFASTLWLPEQVAWDIEGIGFGHIRRQAAIARAIAQRAIVNHSGLRDEPGAAALLEGLAGWVALNCVEKHEGFEASLALRTRMADQVIQSFGTASEAITTTEVARGEWLKFYVPLALDSWSLANLDRNPQQLLSILVSSADYGSLRTALSSILGPKTSERLMGAPRSHDVSLQEMERGQLVTVQHWVWDDGAWQSESAKDNLYERLPASSKPVGGASDGDPLLLLGSQSFGYLQHSQFSFERSLDDNLLRSPKNQAP